MHKVKAPREQTTVVQRIPASAPGNHITTLSTPQAGVNHETKSEGHVRLKGLCAENVVADFYPLLEDSYSEF